MAQCGFSNVDVLHLLHNKFVVIIGDSIQRGLYKDLVSLAQTDLLLSESQLRAKGEYSFAGDLLIEGGRKSKDGMHNGIHYQEVRQYCTETLLIRFYFTTRCYNAYVESILEDLKKGPKPDLVIMNSCLWDLTRYGTKSIEEYKGRLEFLCSRLKQVLPFDTLVIWNTTMPISSRARGGFLVPEVSYCNRTLRLDILEANYFARNVVVNHGYDVLDLHFFFRNLLEWRVEDGIHWRPEAHRHISNILLTHVSNAWGYPLPEAQFFYRQSNVYVGNRMCPERLDSSRYHWRSLSAPTALALYSNPPSFRQQYSDSNGTHHRELQTENYHVDCSSVSREVAQPQPLAINFGNVFNNWTPSNESDYFWEPYTACDFQAKDRRSRNSYKRGFRC
ncbi:PC-esterase domain-containing protein 1A-like isoform X2 [Pomacea canaliculata]|nr:PC-esterase domain-containing protein 1A-like isoform X2 [Pomacea canaliculata]